MGLLRCPRPPLSRQKDQALIVIATLYETGLLGVADRALKLRISQADVAADALSPPPGMRCLGTEAVVLRDERRALKMVSGDQRPPRPHGHQDGCRSNR
jgi:hypothetical protein